MPVSLTVDDLMDYTAWERQKWHDCLQQHGDDVLKITTGPNGDGRFTTVGDLIRHVFSAEKRYVDRLSGRTLTETAAIPNDDIEALFQFGQQSRKELTELVALLPAQDWDLPQDLKMHNSVLTMTPRKIVVHVLLHETRHWAQIATFLRLNGVVDGFHDFLVSPVMGGRVRHEQVTT
jgi:uncharacterized damage-inducible protein DinB